MCHHLKKMDIAKYKQINLYYKNINPSIKVQSRNKKIKNKKYKQAN